MRRDAYESAISSKVDSKFVHFQLTTTILNAFCITENKPLDISSVRQNVGRVSTNAASNVTPQSQKEFSTSRYWKIFRQWVRAPKVYKIGGDNIYIFPSSPNCCSIHHKNFYVFQSSPKYCSNKQKELWEQYEPTQKITLPVKAFKTLKHGMEAGELLNNFITPSETSRTEEVVLLRKESDDAFVIAKFSHIAIFASNEIPSTLTSRNTDQYTEKRIERKLVRSLIILKRFFEYHNTAQFMYTHTFASKLLCWICSLVLSKSVPTPFVSNIAKGKVDTKRKLREKRTRTQLARKMSTKGIFCEEILCWKNWLVFDRVSNFRFQGIKGCIRFYRVLRSCYLFLHLFHIGISQERTIPIQEA